MRDVMSLKRIKGKMFTSHETCSYFIHPSLFGNTFDKVAAFDVDWTASYAEYHAYGEDPDDIKLLSRRLEVFKSFISQGYLLVFFTNQCAGSEKEREKKQARMKTFLSLIDPLPCALFASHSKSKTDSFRKPNTGMWHLMTSLICLTFPLKDSFFVGDSMGRPQDVSGSDRGFADNLRIKAVTPENMFGSYDPSLVLSELRNDKEMVIFVGAPGTGKTFFYESYFKDLDFVHVNQDFLRTQTRVYEACLKCVEKGSSLVIDGSNSSLSDRQKLYHLGSCYHYKIILCYFIRDGRGYNSLREDKKPEKAYDIYFKTLDSPLTEKNNSSQSMVRLFCIM